MWLVEASWGQERSGWTSAPWRSSVQRAARGAEPPLCRSAWAPPVCPRWVTSCSSWGAGTRRRSATRQPSRSTTRPKTAGPWRRISPSPQWECPAAHWPYRLAMRHAGSSTATPPPTRTSSRRTGAERAARPPHKSSRHRDEKNRETQGEVQPLENIWIMTALFSVSEKLKYFKFWNVTLITRMMGNVWFSHYLAETLVLNPSWYDLRITKKHIYLTSDLHKRKIAIRQRSKNNQECTWLWLWCSS